jgi:flagellar biosynthesis/type III secretory pathway M-ring protein FliF/YscJ
MELNFMEIVFWVFVVFVTGLIAYFGRYLAMRIIEKVLGKNSEKKEEQGKKTNEQDYDLKKKKLKLEKKRIKTEKKRQKQFEKQKD